MPVPDDLEVTCWLRQAKADRRAADVTGDLVTEGHRRYWLQQSYEKAIKAWGLMAFNTWTLTMEADFRRHFLFRHSPFLAMQDADAGTPLPKAVWQFRRTLESFLGSLQHETALKRIDATLPTTDPGAVSFRYPFNVAGESWKAPCEYEAWDAYQGDRMAVEAAVDELLRKVQMKLSDHLRKPE